METDKSGDDAPHPNDKKFRQRVSLTDTLLIQ